MVPDPMQDQQGEDQRTVAERAAGGDPTPPEQPEPVLGGDVQLSLDVGKIVPAKARTIERAQVNIAAQSQEVDALFKPDERYPFLVFGVPGDVRTHYVRDPKSTEQPKRVKAVQLTQTIVPDAIVRADTPDAIYDLFSALLESMPDEAVALMERMQQVTAASLRSEPVAA